MNDVTQILLRIESGDPQAAAELLPLVYDELRKLAAAKLAQEKPGQTLSATALVHEAYLRLVDVDQAQHWNSRGHFFAAAAEAMRRILVDRARQKRSLQRGGGWHRVDLSDHEPAEVDRDEKLLALDEALAKLQASDPARAELVKLRYFAGLTSQQAAQALGISESTADRYWAYARAWLQREMSAGERHFPKNSGKSLGEISRRIRTDNRIGCGRTGKKWRAEKCLCGAERAAHLFAPNLFARRRKSP